MVISWRLLWSGYGQLSPPVMRGDPDSHCHPRIAVDHKSWHPTNLVWAVGVQESPLSTG